MQQPPESFVCPITQECMIDPVVDRDGVSYEKTAITTWLKKSQTSPVTRKKLSEKDLIPNRALKAMIEEWKEKQQKQQGGGGGGGQQPKPQEQETPAPNTLAPPPSLPTPPSPSPSSSSSSSPINVQAYKSPINQNEVITVFQTPNNNNSSNSNATRRLPVDICLVLDTSGSMSASAPTSDSDNNKEETGLSVLDVVVHAAQTVCAMLDSTDSISLVSFANSAQIELPLTKCDVSGKRSFNSKAGNLEAKGRTSLWSGIAKGIDVLSSQNNNNNRMSILYVLTDGKPTEQVQYESCLARLLEKNPAAQRIVGSFFGFGYDKIQSAILASLAKQMKGLFNFISDSGMAGCSFVQNTASLLAAAAVNISIDTNPSSSSSSSTTRLGFVQYGHSHAVVSKLNNQQSSASASTLRIKMTTPSSSLTNLEIQVQDASQLSSTQEGKQILAELCLRRKFVSVLEQVGNASLIMRTTSHQALKTFLGELTSEKEMYCSTVKKYYEAVMHDLADEVLLGFSTDDFCNRWGIHFALALASANSQRVSTNFKDKSTSTFATEHFESLRAEGEDKFLELPPPQPRSTSTSASSPSPSLLPTTNLSGATGIRTRRAQPQQPQNKAWSGSSSTSSSLFSSPSDSSSTTSARHVARRSLVRHDASSSASSSSSYIARPAATSSESLSPTSSVSKKNKPAASSAPMMQSYYNQSGGCIEGHANILLQSSETKLARDIKKGDVLFGGKNRVRCVVEILLDSNVPTPLVVFENSSLSITHYHPIRVHCNDNKNKSEWIFPINNNKKVQLVEKNIEKLYTFVLESTSSSSSSSSESEAMSAENNSIFVVPSTSTSTSCSSDNTMIEVCSWGHEMTENDVIRHDFFGSKEKVESSLREIDGGGEGFEVKGRVAIHGFRRDSETMKIVGLF